MRKWLVLLIITAVIGVAYYLVITYVVYTPRWLAGEKTKVRRGDIRSPISASGRVEPAKWIELKPEASGEVTHITVREGDYVLKGDTLVVLDPNDEKRTVEKVQLAVEDARTNSLIAQEQKQRAATSGLLRARATTQASKAEEDESRFRWDKYKDLASYTELEKKLAKASLDAAIARTMSSEAGLQAANSDARLSEYRAELAKKAVQTTERNLADAEERLSETVIKAPTDGMIAKVAVQVGTLVQSGTTSLTGGTPLIKLADTRRLYVIAMVDDADFGVVRRIAPESARPQMRRGNRRRPLSTAPATTNPVSAELAAMKPVAIESASTEIASNPNPDTQPSAGPTPHVDPTKRVKIMVDTFPDDEFVGVIERIDPEGEARGAIVQYRVHVRLISENSFELLMLGLPAQVEFTAESRKNVLMVESRCIRKEGDEYGLFVPEPTPQDKLNTRFVPVRSGISDGTHTEILTGSGLKEGDTVYLKKPAPPKDRGK